MEKAYVGIDLAFAKRKRLPLCICTWQKDMLVPSQLRDFTDLNPPRGGENAKCIDQSCVGEFSREVAQYLRSLQDRLSVQIERIAIDAPMKERPNELLRRRCEGVLGERGISCFSTPCSSDWVDIKRKVSAHLDRGGPHSEIPEANRLWMLVGFALFEELSKQWECIEVYPQAIMHQLGVSRIHKANPEGASLQFAAIAKETGWDGGLRQLRQCVSGAAHDAVDAYASAWVAALAPEKRECLGLPPDDAIWVPSVRRARP